MRDLHHGSPAHTPSHYIAERLSLNYVLDLCIVQEGLRDGEQPGITVPNASTSSARVHLIGVSR